MSPFRRSSRRPRAVPAWVLCWSVLFSSAATAHDAGLLLQAGFVSKFPGFVTWPAAEMPEEFVPFRVCVFGPSALTAPLRELLPYTPIGGGLPTLRRIDTASEASGCDLLFLPGRRLTGLAPIIRQNIGNRPVLLVSEGENALDHGVHIGLVRVGERLRFDVDRSAFERSGLRVSFRLLEMARTVR